MRFQPVVPGLNAQIIIRRENPMRRQLLHPVEYGEFAPF
jgi:hypothetical protein